MITFKLNIIIISFVFDIYDKREKNEADKEKIHRVPFDYTNGIQIWWNYRGKITSKW